MKSAHTMKPGPTQARLKELITYYPDTGKFYWNVRRAGTAQIGAEAGKLSTQGYGRIGIDGVRYFAHRLAWLYMTGEWPELHIDHIDGDRGNNRFANLRLVTLQQNAWNQRRPQQSNPYIGVSWMKRYKHWQASIGLHGKRIVIGYFDTPEKAHAAYLEAKAKLHGIDLRHLTAPDDEYVVRMTHAYPHLGE